MKKILLWIVAIVLVVGLSVAAYMAISTKDKPVDMQPIDDPLFVYVDLAQLATNGAFDKYVTAENRNFVATVLSSQLEGTTYAEHLKNIITNLDTVGLDTQKPIYGYLSDDLTHYVAVANVLDVAQVDKSISLLSYLLEQEGEDAISVVTEGDTRLLEYEGVAVAYNVNSLALVCGGDSADLSVAKKAINRPQMDMSVFGDSDIAVLVNTDRCVQLASAQVNDAMALLTQKYNNGEVSQERYNAQMEELTANNELINSYSAYFKPDSKVLLSATFDLGRFTLAFTSQGINMGENSGVGIPTNMAHLSNIGSDAYAVMSAGVNGKQLSQFVRTALSGEVLRSVGITPTNEVNMFVSIACDALSTINGGVTLALESVDGEIKPRYNHYWDEYYIEPAIKSVEAMLMADVTDTYIISNVAQFAGGFLRKVDATHYTLQLMNYNFSMGQDESLFHLGVNMSPKTQSPSALDTEWAKDVDGAMGYVVVNFDALMASGFMKSTNKYITSQLMEEYRGLYDDATEAVSYVYAAVDSLEAAEVVVVFDDKSINALEQINAIVLPTLISEGLKSLY